VSAAAAAHVATVVFFSDWLIELHQMQSLMQSVAEVSYCFLFGLLAAQRRKIYFADLWKKGSVFGFKASLMYRDGSPRAHLRY